MGEKVLMITAIVLGVILFGTVALLVKWYKKPRQGQALVRTGKGGTRITFDYGFFVIPILHTLEIMDITLKSITISRTGVDGLICKDNMRADIKVTFFMKINNKIEAAALVAMSIGCSRASDQDTLIQLFDAKFSEGLKTAGKRFDFVDLYTERDKFKKEILNIIGQDLNGYTLDDCAIDYLEQTSIDTLKKNNILDSEGIKKITELTARQLILANQIEREKEKTITQQNVESREIILALERQLASKEEIQKKEVANIKDREQAEIMKVREEQKLISENAKIATEEAIQIGLQNKERNIIIAQRNKERTDAIEQEKLKQDVELKQNERQRIVTLAQIEKEKAVEEEKKNIQEVIRERVTVEKAVIAEQEKIKDTQAFAEADRNKKVAITNAETIAEEALVKQIKAAEAGKQAAEFNIQTILLEADTKQKAAVKDGEAQKILAEAKAAQEASFGVSEAQVMEAKAKAKLKQGETDSQIIELNAIAEAKAVDLKSIAEAKRVTLISEAESKGITLKSTAEANAIKMKGEAEAESYKLMELADAESMRQKGFAEADSNRQKGLAQAESNKQIGLAQAESNKQIGLAQAESNKQIGLAEAEVTNAKAKAEENKGLAEANVIKQKLEAEAEGIKAKAESMKLLDTVGKDHEEFKLKLEKDKQVELAQINIQVSIANAQASIISSALKSAKIDIVGGETMFFDKIINSVSWSKTVDKFVDTNSFINEIKNHFLNNGKDVKNLDTTKKDEVEIIDEHEVENNNIVENQENEHFEEHENINEEHEIIEEAKNPLMDITNVSEKNFRPVLKSVISSLSISVKDIQNLKLSELFDKIKTSTSDELTKTIIQQLIKVAKERGYMNVIAKTLGIK